MQGFALTQAIDLYNFRKSLQAGANTNYMALRLVTDNAKTLLMQVNAANEEYFRSAV